MLSNVTASVLFYNTDDLIPVSIGSFRKFYPDMDLLVVDNSDDGICSPAIDKFIKDDKYTMVLRTGKNLGHGIGADLCITKPKSKYVYIFESDVLMYKAGLIEAMLELMDDKTYGIGRLDDLTYEGYDWLPADWKGRSRKRIWIFASLINVEQYLKFPRFNSDRGTNAEPVVDAMRAIEDSGRSTELLKQFNTEAYVEHLYGGTRKKVGIPGLAHYEKMERTYDIII